MAKSRKPVKRSKSAKKTKPRKAVKQSYQTKGGRERRDNKGRFLSKDAYAARQNEIGKRLSSKYERAKEQARQKEEARKWHVAERKKKASRTRGKNGKLKSLYSNESKGQSRLERDSDTLSIGVLPASHDKRKVGRYYLHYWVWYGSDAVKAVEDFLTTARENLPGATLGRVAIGTSYSKKHGDWVGTATLPIKPHASHRKNLLQAYFTLLTRDSGQSVFGFDAEAEVWAEVELLLEGKTV
jgi:hypothetical protein